MKYDLDGRLIWSRTWGGMGLDIARSVAVVGDSVYVTGMTYGMGNDGQAFLLKYTSPNKSWNQMVDSLLIAAILAIGIILWMTMVREALARLL